MTSSNQQTLGLLSKLVIMAALSMIAVGVLWHGVSLGELQRFWENLLERPSRPMAFRFILQPAMAASIAIRAGISDAQTGHPPYLWAVLREAQERTARLREALNATAKIILIGLVMDIVYQVVVLRTFYPGEALVIALLLAFVPYLLIRGPSARIARRWHGSQPAGSSKSVS